MHRRKSPVRVPPRRMPAHYKSEVDDQIQRMLQQGIITESNSPWVAPAVYVTKKDGGLRICVDYRELNKRTVKDAYPLPLIDDIQSHLSGAVVFSTLDLNSGYWQLPIHPDDRYKTAFTPGPGMGLYEFVCRPTERGGRRDKFPGAISGVARGGQPGPGPVWGCSDAGWRSSDPGWRSSGPGCRN